MLVFAVGGLVLLVVVWPTERSARNLLRAWRVADPTPEQVAEALSYLRKRRFWYPWIFLVIPLLGDRYDWGEGVSYQFVVPVMAGLLVAELAALRPSRHRVRTASLTPRRLFDLVPRWAVACHAVLVSATVGYAVVGIAAQPWAAEYGRAMAGGAGSAWAEELAEGSKPWVVLGITVLSLLAVVAVVWSAMVRSSGADVVVDGVLRTRSSRVVLGLGIGLQGTLLAAGARRLTMVAGFDQAPEWVTDLYRATGWFVLVGVVGSVLAWVWVANPPLPRPYFSRVR